MMYFLVQSKLSEYIIAKTIYKNWQSMEKAKH